MFCLLFFIGSSHILFFFCCAHSWKWILFSTIGNRHSYFCASRSSTNANGDDEKCAFVCFLFFFRSSSLSAFWRSGYFGEWIMSENLRNTICWEENNNNLCLITLTKVGVRSKSQFCFDYIEVVRKREKGSFCNKRIILLTFGVKFWWRDYRKSFGTWNRAHMTSCNSRKI